MNERKAYQDKVEAQLKEWNAEIEKLTAKALKADADARIALSDKVDTLRKHFQEAQNAFVGMVAASEEAWAEAKTRVENTRNAFIEAWHTTREEFGAEPVGSGRSG